MKDKNLTSPEERDLANMLEAAAQEVDINASFKNELEKKLMNAHKPKTGLGLFSIKKAITTIGWTIGLAAMTLMFIWVIRAIAPKPQPAAGFAPVIETPATESSNLQSAFDYIVKDGDTCSFVAYKNGVTIKEIVSFNNLPSTCPITIGQIIKIPINGNVTYNLNGQPLSLNASLPETPAEMKVYLAKDEIRASVEDVKTLAERFGMNAEIYQVAGESGDTTDYLAVDGNQQLRMRSDQYLTYFPNYAGMALAGVFSAPPNAEALIQEFMQAHGFNFEYRIEQSQLFGTYLVLPLTPDGFMVHHEQFKFSGLMFYFNQERIQFVDINLLKYDEAATVGIISAEEAFQKLLDPVAGNGAGILMGMIYNGQGDQPEVTAWRRTFPLDQTITYFGYMGSTGKSITGAAPLVTLNGYTVTGNVEGVTENMQNVFIKATGQFHEVNGYKTFEFQSWEVYDGYDEGLAGTIQREGEQVVINTIEGKKLILPDMPSDVPLPLVEAYIMGVTQGDTFEWKSFDTRPLHGGGGGGGGGLGFYKLNLTGTPVPLPTPEQIQSPTQPAMDEALTGVIGITQTSIYNQADGTQRIEYNFLPNNDNQRLFWNGILEGNVEGLSAYHNLPVKIWGRISGIDKNQLPIVTVEKYEVLFTDLHFQILTGTQKMSEIQGEPIVLFTASDGQTYVELASNNDPIGDVVGQDGDQIQNEVVIIPGETFGGYPVIHVYSASPVSDPSNSLTITSDQPYVMDEPPAQDDYVPPTIAIEKVELVYYMPDPRYITSELVVDQRYLQPVWRFYGHYSDGSEFEYLIQALKSEFLLPELAPYTQPG